VENFEGQEEGVQPQSLVGVDVRLAFVFVLVGDALYWSHLGENETQTFLKKYLLAMFLLAVVANVVGHLLKQHLIFIASLGVLFPNLLTLLSLTKIEYIDNPFIETSEKARAAVVLIWIGLGFSFIVAPVKRRKHLEPSSPRVILGSILSIGLVVAGIIMATSKVLEIRVLAYASTFIFFIAIIFTVAWATKPDHTQVITSFLCGAVTFGYIGVYHSAKNLNSDQVKAGLILSIILMGLAVAFLNIPIFTRYKKKDKKKDKQKRRDREDAPLVS